MTVRKGHETSQSSSRSWSALTPSLPQWILDAISSMGFSQMTPVQASAIPLFTGNKDVVVEAVTGSGKTLAFLIPVIQRLLSLDEPLRKHHIGGIIISPTRELATQIYTVLISILAFHAPSAAQLKPMSVEDDTQGEDRGGEKEDAVSDFPADVLKIVPQLLLGGSTTPSQDLAQFLTNGSNLLVATPGRLVELLSSRHVHCPQSSFQVLVMDEADRLLDMGFKEDLSKIFQRIPKQRRTGLFSASMSDAVDELIRVGLRNPMRISVKVKSRTGDTETRTPSSLEMTYLTTPPTHKFPALVHLLHSTTPLPQKSIAYLSTCAAVDYFQHLLPKILPSHSRLTVIPLHGKHPPSIRQKNFARFVDSVLPVLLLTTDLAARGLDIPAVDLTVQLDPPSDPKTFLHRAGRAGRAGRKGLACVFLLPGHETDDYPPFLSVRRTPVTPLTKPKITVSDAEAAACIAAMRAEVRRDRALHDKAQKAFVSWVRSYSKHTASSIFSISRILWDETAAAWALLKMPRMPELKRADSWSGDVSLGEEVDWEHYAYRDKEREKKRRESTAADEVSEHTPRKKVKAEAWSGKHAAQAEREARREKKGKKREKEQESKMGTEEKERAEELKRMIQLVRAQNQAGRS